MCGMINLKRIFRVLPNVTYFYNYRMLTSKGRSSFSHFCLYSFYLGDFVENEKKYIYQHLDGMNL